MQVWAIFYGIDIDLVTLLLGLFACLATCYVAQTVAKMIAKILKQKTPNNDDDNNQHQHHHNNKPNNGKDDAKPEQEHKHKRTPNREHNDAPDTHGVDTNTMGPRTTSDLELLDGHPDFTTVPDDETSVGDYDHSDNECSRGVTVSGGTENTVVECNEEFDRRISRRKWREAAAEGSKKLNSKADHPPTVRFASAMQAFAVVVQSWFTGGGTSKKKKFTYRQGFLRPKTQSIGTQLRCAPPTFRHALLAAWRYYGAQMETMMEEKHRHEAVSNALDYGYHLQGAKKCTIVVSVNQY